MHPITNPPEKLLIEVNAFRARYGRARVTALQLDGKPCYLKQTGVAKHPWPMIRIHKFLSPLLPCILRNARHPDETGALRREGARLQAWNELSLPAPALLGLYDDFMVTADAGTWFLPFIRNADMTTRKTHFQQALLTLQRIHAKDRAHGRPMIKDIAITDDGRISWLDLEEDTESIMPLADAKARDIFIFLSSIMPYLDDADAAVLCRSALAAIAPDVRASLDTTFRWVACVNRTLGWIDNKKLGREISSMLRLYHIWRITT